ncbi:hypothetical protein [Nocardia sp. NPDC004604]|uniref:hypothetical protein n=1 Tax=Nocardia sp. NPDC004604 TaxID=3157013 RepID=UPI0033B5B10B
MQHRYGAASAELDRTLTLRGAYVLVVELNRAVAIAQAGDPAAALRAVDHLDLDGYLYFYPTLGELFTASRP